MLVLFLIPEQILRCIKWEARHVSVAQVRMSAKSAPQQPSLSAGITFCLWGVPLRATPCEDGGMAGEWSSWRQNPRPQFTWARACQGCAHGDLIFTQPETARWAAIAMGLRGAKQGKCMSGPFRRLFAGNAICCSPRGLRCTLGRGMSRRRCSGKQWPRITSRGHALGLRKVLLVCVMRLMMVASFRRLHLRGFVALAPRLSLRSPLPAITTPEASFCGCCNVQQTHSVRRLLAACGLRSVPTMFLR